MLAIHYNQVTTALKFAIFNVFPEILHPAALTHQGNYNTLTALKVETNKLNNLSTRLRDMYHNKQRNNQRYIFMPTIGVQFVNIFKDRST